jgi:L,D-transpeptidase catalytic domain
MKNSFKIQIPVFIFLLNTLSYCVSAEDVDIHQLLHECKLDGVISFEVFNTAILGYYQIDNLNKKDIITIIDFSKPSTKKRFYVIDLINKHLLYECFVAHGKNSGDNYAKNFSNLPESLESSLGFFLTAETYYGNNGYSLRLEGLEKGINDNARSREIVIHGAEYVSEEFIKKYGRLGRSWGCPALPVEISKDIIDQISGGSCLFIYGDDKNYKENSIFLSRK